MTNTFKKDHERLMSIHKVNMYHKNIVLGYSLIDHDNQTETLYSCDFNSVMKMSRIVKIPNNLFNVGGWVVVDNIPDKAEYIGTYTAQ